LLNKKQKGLPIEKATRQPAGNVVNLMDALKASLKADTATKPSSKGRPAKASKSASRRKAG
jgi:non-homologous end joining protein Ku